VVVTGAALAPWADTGLRHGMTAAPAGPEPDLSSIATVRPTLERDGPAFLDAEATTLAGLVSAGEWRAAQITIASRE
jgi:hypothetical protein